MFVLLYQGAEFSHSRCFRVCFCIGRVSPCQSQTQEVSRPHSDASTRSYQIDCFSSRRPFTLSTAQEFQHVSAGGGGGGGHQFVPL